MRLSIGRMRVLARHLPHHTNDDCVLVACVYFRIYASAASEFCMEMAFCCACVWSFVVFL